MNFSQVRGYNAYALFSAKIKEFSAGKADAAASAFRGGVSEDSGLQRGDDISVSTYSEPVDIVTISEPARKASDALAAKQSAMQQWPAVKEKPQLLRESAPHTELREWIRTAGRTAGMLSGGFSRSIPGSVMNKALGGSGITAEDDEQFTVSVNVLSTVTVAGKNAEKAKAIQDLLNSTPSGINWGMLLAKLPPQ